MFLSGRCIYIYIYIFTSPVSFSERKKVAHDPKLIGKGVQKDCVFCKQVLSRIGEQSYALDTTPMVHQLSNAVSFSFAFSYPIEKDTFKSELGDSIIVAQTRGSISYKSSWCWNVSLHQILVAQGVTGSIQYSA